jgi:flagellar protein FlaG
MVGKLNGNYTAAVIFESTLRQKANESSKNNQQNLNDRLQSESVANGQSTLNVAGTQDAQATNLKQNIEGEPKEEKLSEAAVKKMIEDLNEFMEENEVKLEFSYEYDQDADMFNVKVIDKDTKKVLREFPPEEMLDSIKKAKEWLGAIIDELV